MAISFLFAGVVFHCLPGLPGQEGDSNVVELAPRVATRNEPFSREIVTSDQTFDLKAHPKHMRWVLHAEENKEGKLTRPAALSSRLRQDDIAALKSAAMATADSLAADCNPEDSFEPSKVLDRLRRSLESYRAAIGTSAERPNDSAMMLSRAAPIARLATGLLRGLDDGAWAATRPGAITFFSTKPSPGCITLKPFALALVNKLAEESSALSKAWSNDTRALSAQDKVAYGRYFSQSWSVDTHYTALLAVQRTNASVSYYVQVFAPGGELLSGIRLFEPIKAVTAVEPQYVPITEQAKAFLEASDFTTPQSALTSRSDRKHLLESRLHLDPHRLDYIDVSTTYALKELAKHLGVPHFFACVPDWVMSTAYSCVSGDRFDVAAFANKLESDAKCEFKIDGDHLLVRPKNPLESEAERADRASLASLWHAAETGQLSLRFVSKYYNSQNRFLVTGSNPVTALATKAAYELFPQGCDWGRMSPATLQLLGDLSDGEWQAMLVGAPINFSPGQHIGALQLFAMNSARPPTPVARTEASLAPTSGLGQAAFAGSGDNALLVQIVDRRMGLLQVKPGKSRVPFVGRDPQTQLIGPGSVEMEDAVYSGVWWSLSDLIKVGRNDLTDEDIVSRYKELERDFKFYYAQQTVLSVEVLVSGARSDAENITDGHNYCMVPVTLSDVPGLSLPGR